VSDSQSDSRASRRAGLAPPTRVLMTLAAAVIVIVGFSLGRNVIGPFMLGAVVVIVVDPLRHLIERRGGPRWLGTIVVVVVALLILAIMLLLIVVAGAQFLALLSTSASQLSEVSAQLATAISRIGIPTSGEIVDPSVIASAVGGLASYLLGSAATLVLVLIYILFMGIDSGRYGQIPASLAAARQKTIRSLATYTSGVRRYFVVSAIFGLIVAVLDGILLVLLGVPGAFIWAVLAFVTNFIPNIGFVLGLIPAAFFALLSGGWVIALVVVLAYCVINAVLQELVQPKFVSDAVHLSLTLTFLSVVFWSAVLGPLGALLSIPLTLLIRELLTGTDPDAAWSRWLTGDAVRSD
jgi:AI-2 transport protein TqsA